ncbi:MAG: glycosyltransferase family 4 protein [Lachnospiraceae bacterium]|nr:glycosyltransferase family 4 protein [Lachnospiraceae bacterium]
MRLFLVGDDWSGTGPANATLALRKSLPSDTLYLKTKNKLLRASELFYKMKQADAVVFSGHSKQNILGMRIAKKMHIPSIYIMHGCVEYENKINKREDAKMAADERTMMKEADLLLAVSRQFEDWLKDNYPEYKDKIAHLTNGIDWDQLKETHDMLQRDMDAVLSVGGGMPRKRIVNICEAIGILRKEGYPNLHLIVAGAEGEDTDKINSYDYVENIGLVDAKKMQETYRNCRLFIQNSIFETFGLAPVEALMAGDDILLSKHCGVLSVLGGVGSDDIIEDPDNTEEIAEKIRNILKNENHTRLLVETDKESTSWKKRAEELMQIAEEVRQKTY